jgi:hypothetical protein
MSAAWAAVILVGLGTVAIKAAGPVLFVGSTPASQSPRWLELLGPALLAALVVTSTLARDRAIVLDDRAAGVAAAGLVLALRGPLILAVAAAALVTAVLRAL